jgi:hypothetical protein
MGYNWTALLSSEPLGSQKGEGFPVQLGNYRASPEESFFMELINQNNSKPLMAQNYRSICNNVQCALFMEEAKGERKMLWYANPFLGAFANVRKSFAMSA